jgi:transposase-like protein
MTEHHPALRVAAGAGGTTITALAREHGVSRTTIRRRLASGWTPSHVEVLPPSTTRPPVCTEN